MPNLSDFLPLEAVQPSTNPQLARAGREAGGGYEKWMDSVCTPALKHFFRALREEGRVNRVLDSEGYLCRTWAAWNTLAEATPSSSAFEDALDVICEVMSHRLVVKMLSPFLHAVNAQGPEAAAKVDVGPSYAQAVAEFNEGTFKWHELDAQTCQNTGWWMCTQFKEWSQVMGLRIEAGVPGRLPAQPPVARIGAETVTFTSGRLIIVDWPRVDGFEISEKGLAATRESRDGKQATTAWYAQQQGFVHVPLYDSPTIYAKASFIVAGSDKDSTLEDIGQYKRMGLAITDLWAATVIDYDKLVEIVMRRYPKEAPYLVDAYLADTRRSITEVRVTPGTYYLYHHGEASHFECLVKKAGYPVDEARLQPYFLLSPTPISELSQLR